MRDIRVFKSMGFALFLWVSVGAMAKPPEQWQALFDLAYHEPEQALVEVDDMRNQETGDASIWKDVIAASALHRLNRFSESQSRLIDVESRIQFQTVGILHVMVHRMLGQNFYRMGGFDQAMNQALKAKLYAEQTKQRDEYAQITNLMAAIYLRSRQFDLALDSFQQALAYFETVDSKADIAKLKNNIAAVFIETERFDEAETYLSDALLLATELNRSTTLITVHVNRIELYAKQNRFDAAEDSVATCLQLATQSDLPSFEIWCLEEAAEMYQLSGDRTEAITKAQQAHSMAEQQNLHQSSIELGKLLVTLLTADGEYQQALDMSARTLIQVEQLRDEVVTLKLDEIRALNEVEQTRSELKLMQQQNKLQEQRQRMTWIGIGILIPMLVAALLLLRSKQHLLRALNRQQGRTEAALEDMRVAKEENERLAKTDHLTGLSNRRELSQLLRHMCQQSEPLQASVLMIDIDHFKQVNDQYGHNAGDMVLMTLSQILQQQLPDNAYSARWGGEEFMVALTDTNLPQALKIAEQLRTTVANEKVPYEQHAIEMTISIGVAEYNPGDGMEAWVQRADEALYVSKTGGRNKVTVYGSIDSA